DYDEGMMEYTVLEGLAREDRIAVPMGTELKEGMPTADIEDYVPEEDGMTDEGMSDGDMMTDEGMMDEGMFEEDMQDGAKVEEGIPEEAEWPEEDVVVVEEDKGAVG
ncbi:MAG: hypothetical protein II715_02740, partial [Clostridia bacterium]|nr:hypothetical protein [Clostridia bacterium]